MAPIPSFPPDIIEGISRILGDTGGGFTGSEIGRLLQQSRIPDPVPTETKWRRIDQALTAIQVRDKCANNVVAFLHTAMNPSRYVRDEAAFRDDGLR